MLPKSSQKALKTLSKALKNHITKPRGILFSSRHGKVGDVNDVASLTPHKNHRSQRGSLDRERRRDVRDGKKEGDAPPIVRGSTYVLPLRNGSARGAVCLEPHLRRRFAPPKREGPPRRFAPRSSAKNFAGISASRKQFQKIFATTFAKDFGTRNF